MTIYYLMTLASVIMETAKNVFSNSFSKNTLKNTADVYKYNTVMYAGSFVVMVVILCVRGISASWYSVWMALLFAAVSGGMQASFLRALKCGPLSYVNFIQTSGLIIPTFYGALFLRQSVSAVQIAALPFLILSMALVMDLKRGETGRGKWLPDALVSMLCLGLVGVVQAMHQASVHAGEIDFFLAVTFLGIVVSNLIPWLLCERKEKANFSVRKKEALNPFTSGVFMGIVNVVNLFLIGVMPTVIFFPLANGGLLILTILAAVVFFREKLNAKQLLGIAIGMVSMYLLGR